MLRAFLVITTFVAALALMMGTFVLRMTGEIFDSGQNSTTWSVFLFIWAMPVLLIVGVAVGWIAYARRARTVAWLGLAIALAPLLIAAGIIAIAG